MGKSRGLNKGILLANHQLDMIQGVRQIAYVKAPPHAWVLSPAQGKVQLVSGSLFAKEFRVDEHQHSRPYSSPAYWSLPQNERQFEMVVSLDAFWACTSQSDSMGNIMVCVM